jgi:HTH-type transcriptional regulator/antitoxin HipB
MAESKPTLPLGNIADAGSVIRSTGELGDLIRQRRRSLNLKQLDIAGLGNTGNRFIVDLEGGKPTVQLQKALDVLNLLGLEVVVRPRAAGGM